MQHTFDRVGLQGCVGALAFLLLIGLIPAGVAGWSGSAYALPAPVGGADPVINTTSGAPCAFSGVAGADLCALGPTIAIPAGATTALPLTQGWTLSLNDKISSSLNTQWVAGDHIAILVEPSSCAPVNTMPGLLPGAGCNDVSAGGGPNWVGFGNVPTVTAGGGPSVGAVLPTVTVAIHPNAGANPATRAIVKDVLEISFTNSGTSNSTTPYTLTINNITLSTGASTPTGPIAANGRYGSSLSLPNNSGSLLWDNVFAYHWAGGGFPGSQNPTTCLATPSTCKDAPLHSSPLLEPIARVVHASATGNAAACRKVRKSVTPTSPHAMQAEKLFKKLKTKKGSELARGFHNAKTKKARRAAFQKARAWCSSHSSGGSPPHTASCTGISAVPSGATAVTTAPVDFDGDNIPDTFRVYRVGNVWHARAEIANVGVDDEIVSGPGPAMTAIGGATINNDAPQEAWIKVGSGASTDIISFFVFRQCQLQRVRLNNAPAEFPIGAGVTHADGLGCFGFNVGIEVFSTNSNDGSTFAGNSKIYTVDLSGTAPKLVLGTTAPQSETSPPGGPAFDALSTFNCDTLGPSIP